MGRPRRVPASLLIGPLLAALLSGAVAAPAVMAATSMPPTIVPAVDSGPPGLTVGITGSGFQAGTTYGLCLQPPNATANCGYAGSDLGSFAADAGGNVPSGAQFSVPNVLAGSYRVLVTAPGSAATVAVALFGVTTPTLALSTNVGPGGLAVTVTGSGYGPSAAYVLCIVPSGTPQCGGVGIELGRVTADTSGDLPSGTSVTIPGQLAATYDVGIKLDAGGVPYLISTQPFVEVAPTIALNPTAGPGGTEAAMTGAGLAPGGKYTICLVPPATTQCGGTGTDLLSFVADAGGAVPDGTTVTIPAGPTGDYPVGIVLEGSTPFLLGSVTFSRTAGSPPPSGQPGEPTATPAAEGNAGGSASPSPAAGPAASDQGSSGLSPWILVILAIVAVVVVGLVLSRRRRVARRR